MLFFIQFFSHVVKEKEQKLLNFRYYYFFKICKRKKKIIAYLSKQDIYIKTFNKYMS